MCVQYNVQLKAAQLKVFKWKERRKKGNYVTFVSMLSTVTSDAIFLFTMPLVTVAF